MLGAKLCNQYAKTNLQVCGKLKGNSKLRQHSKGSPELVLLVSSFQLDIRQVCKALADCN